MNDPIRLVAQLLNKRYNLPADRQGFKISQKYYNFGLAALVFIVSGWGLGLPAGQAAETASITGTVRGEYEAQTVMLVYNENIEDMVLQRTAIAELDKEGKFFIQVALEHPYAAFLRFEMVDYPVFLRQESQLEVELDALSGKLNILGGEGGDDARAYQHIRKYFPRLDYPLQWTLDQKEKNSGLTPNQLVPLAEKRQRQQSVHLNKMQEKLQLSEAYLRYEKNNIFYGTAMAKYAYHKHYAQEKQEAYGENWKTAHHDYLDSMLVAYPVISPFGYALACHNFTQYLQAFMAFNYIKFLQSGNIISELDRELAARWEIVEKVFPTNLRDYGRLTLITRKYFNDSQTYDYLDKETFTEYMKKFKEISDNAFYKRLLDYEYRARYNPEALKDVTDSPYGLVKYRSIETKRRSTETLDHFLKQNRGKVVMIEFWESACQPAITEMPKAQQFIKEYADKDIAFLMVSLDREKYKWLRVLRQYPIPESYQHRVPSGTASALAKRYGVIRLPRYLLFNKQGVLVYENAPGFTETSALKQQIDSLLQSP